MSIGRITGPQGLGGEVRVFPLTDRQDRLAGLSQVHVCFEAADAAGRETRRELATIEAWRPHGALWVVKFAGVVSREGAEGMRGALLQVPPEGVPSLPEGSYYHFQLIGLAVFTTAGEPLGRIRDVLSTGANDVWVVERPKSVGPSARGRRGDEILIPALKAVVRSVDLAAGRVEVALPPGLVEE